MTRIKPRVRLTGGAPLRWVLSVGAAAVIVGAIVWLTAPSRQTGESPVVPLPGPGQVSRSELTLREGRLWATGEANPFNGLMTEFYPDEVLKSRSSVTNGLLEGLSEGWYTNGQRQVEEHFKAGVSEGLRTKWYADGRKMSEATIVDGKLHGRYQRWHENGELAEQIDMKEGKPHGLSLAFYRSGSLKAQVRLSDGEVVDQRFWSEEDRQPAPSP